MVQRLKAPPLLPHPQAGPKPGLGHGLQSFRGLDSWFRVPTCSLGGESSSHLPGGAWGPTLGCGNRATLGGREKKGVGQCRGG